MNIDEQALTALAKAILVRGKGKTYPCGADGKSSITHTNAVCAADRGAAYGVIESLLAELEAAQEQFGTLGEFLDSANQARRELQAQIDSLEAEREALQQQLEELTAAVKERRIEGLRSTTRESEALEMITKGRSRPCRV